jgi:hypothetical protein
MGAATKDWWCRPWLEPRGGRDRELPGRRQQGAKKLEDERIGWACFFMLCQLC